MSFTSTANKVLVVGATGATGKHVVRYLLERGGTTVVALVRSKEKLMGLLKLDEEKRSNLIVKEAAISDLGTEELKEITEGCGAIVSCLGHNLTFRGMYRDGPFLIKAVKNLTASMPKSCRFILMNSDGVANPDGSDPKRTYVERCVIALVRWLVPPHVDNEKSALYLYQNPSFDWVIVRPGDLVDKEEEEIDYKGEKAYDVYDHPQGSLFGSGNTSARSDVADFMAELATTDQKTWKEVYNHKMPAVYGKKETEQYKPSDSKGTK